MHLGEKERMCIGQKEKDDEMDALEEQVRARKENL